MKANKTIIKKNTKYLALILCITMIMSLTACGEDSVNTPADEGTTSGTESTSDPAAAYNEILEGLDSEAGETDGQIVVAVSPDLTPLEFVDLSREGDDQYVGYDILLAKYIANHLGRDLVIKPMSFDAVQAAVQTGSADMGISGFSWTEDRSEKFFVTDWYEAGDNEEDQVVITTKSNEGKFITPEDFAGARVGVQSGSLQKILAEDQLPDAELSLYDNLNDAAAALLDGKIDALAVVYRSGESFISANPGELIFSGFQFEVDDLYKNNVVLLNKDNEKLGKQVNAIIAQQKSEGVADAWYKACQLLAQIDTADKLGYDDKGKKISE